MMWWLTDAELVALAGPLDVATMTDAQLAAIAAGIEPLEGA